MILPGSSMNLERLFDRAIQKRLCSGGVVGVVRGDERHVIPFGTMRYGDSELINENTIFDVASVTKTIPTSTLALMAYYSGLIELDTPIADLVPLRGTYAEQVRFKHLLTQTLAYTIPLSSLRFLTPHELLDEILSFDFPVTPGVSFNYCNATSIVLGLVVEKLYGQCLDHLAAELLFTPLEMRRTYFKPPGEVITDIVPTEIDTWRGREIRGEVHDESAFRLQEMITPGSAGLFSTVPDILNFLTMMLHDGWYNNRRILPEGVLETVSENQLEGLGLYGGLGWELNQRRYTGTFASERTIGKTGFTGSVIMIDVEKEVGLTLVTNFTYPRRKSDPTRINSLRSAVADEVFRHYS